MKIEDKIQNSHLLTNIFGGWPSFHDAEVLNLTLERKSTDASIPGPELIADIYVFTMTSKVNNEGKYVLENKTKVRLHFQEIQELEIAGFDQQNVLMGLSIKDISDQQLERAKFQISIDGVFGMEATFQCFKILVHSAKSID